ncbi:MAG: hypothetical protein WDA22_15280 [Bacteroidota bacterium]
MLVHKNIKWLIIIILMLTMINNYALSQNRFFERNKTFCAKVDSCLKFLNEITSSTSLTLKYILQIYNAEKLVGGLVNNATSGIQSPEGMEPPCLDSTLGYRCLQYVQRNITHFRMVDDGWKGENNFMEPYKFWDSVAQHIYPNSPEANEISFDIDFNDLVRKYSFTNDIAGETCEHHCRREFQRDSTHYLEYYSRDEIDKWPQECAQKRAQFESERNKLLQKYGITPFTKRLRDIDITTIVIDHTVC